MDGAGRASGVFGLPAAHGAAIAAAAFALGAWGLNLLGVAGFSWVLFGRKRLDEALGVTAGMVVSSAAAVGTAAMVDRRAAAADLPLLPWVVFATILQEEVWRRN